MARIQAGTPSSKQRQNSAHPLEAPGRPLPLLEEAAAQAMQGAFAVLQLANQRGLVEKAKILSTTMDRLRNRVAPAQEALAVVEKRPVLH